MVFGIDEIRNVEPHIEDDAVFADEQDYTKRSRGVGFVVCETLIRGYLVD
jgi:hypothetical protein